MAISSGLSRQDAFALPVGLLLDLVSCAAGGEEAKDGGGGRGGAL